jgi:Holliday junction resolvase RusA-like endonuclease
MFRLKKTIVFAVNGTAVGKARPRARLKSLSSGRHVVKMYTPGKTVRYENMVRVAFRGKHCGHPHQGPVAVSIRACFTIPSSWPTEWKKEAKDQMGMYSKPDIDNIAKSVLDGLNGVAYVDDKQVYSLSVTKEYTSNVAAITIIRVDLFDKGGDNAKR